MSKSISNIITNLKQTAPLNQYTNFTTLLNDIDKYSANDNIKAYFLGYFFKHHFDLENLEPKNKRLLLSVIRENNHSIFFDLKEKPKLKAFSFHLYAFLIIGLIAITVGIIELINRYYSFGLNIYYQTPVFREGWFFIMFGLILFVGAILSLRFERRRKNFIESFLG